MKKIITISVDVDTWMIAKTKTDNISSYLNESLKALIGRTETDTKIEDIQETIKRLKIEAQENAIKQSLAQETLKDIEQVKVLKDKEIKDNDQFMRWKCPACQTMNFMTDNRCRQCTLPTRNDKKTEIINTKGDEIQ